MNLRIKIIKRSSFKIGFGQTTDRSNRIMRSLFSSKIININYSIKKDPLNFWYDACVYSLVFAAFSWDV